MHKKLLASCGVSIAAVCSLAATICTPPPETSAISSRVDLELSDVVSIRILDKTATTAIDSLDLELVVTPTGAFTSDNFIVEAATSNRTGYKLYMSTDFQKGDPATYTTDLVNQEDDTYTIPTLGTGGVSLADFSQARGSSVNRWGYSLDNLTYDPVPAHNTTEEIGSSSTASAADRTDVYIGVNANMDKISGLYKNTLVFSGVANPIQTDYTLHFLPGTEESVTDLPTDQSVSEVSASHTFTIPSTAPSRVGYNFTGYTDGTTTYQPGSTITVMGEEDFTGSATLTAEWELASYTITVSNTNTTSGAASLTIPYGGSATVTVTPDSNYYLSSISCPSGYTCTGYTTGIDATNTQTVTVANNSTESGGTLSFTGALRAFTVSISNSNTSSGSPSITVPYGGSNTVTVTPTSGYYLSSVSCPSGYTCTGYSTGTSATGQQTVTVTNNNIASGGTLSFTGTLDTRTLAQKCSGASTGSTFMHSNVQYIKLNNGSNGACYTKTSQGTATFDNAATLCPSGTGVPSLSEFQSLINAYGSDGTIYNTTGWSGYYLSSTPDSLRYAYGLYVSSSRAGIDFGVRTDSYPVVCIVR